MAMNMSPNGGPEQPGPEQSGQDGGRGISARGVARSFGSVHAV
jgi:hypothetical protein